MLLTGANCSISLDDIILGPPKTAFASSRIASKGSIDAAERSSRPFESDEPKNDRFNFRDKIFRDKDAGDRDYDRRDSRPGAYGFRRGDHKEDWKEGRPRRNFGPDDHDRKPRRNGDFDRWEGKDNRDPRDNERGPKERDGRFMSRRDGQHGRSRFEGSWFRDDNGHVGPDGEEERPSYRNREWRRDRHGADRDWTRGSKFEQEPEWLDSTEPEEPRRVHTQEDFQRWKEKMKAGSAQAQEGEKKEPPVENVTGETPKAENRPTDGEIFSHGGAPLQSDMTMERFFGLLGEKKPTPAMSSPSPIESPAKEKPAAKPMKSSRFAGLFSPTPESRLKEPEPQAGIKPTPSPNTASSDADQEGFQRILQMLGSSKSRNGTPHNEHTQHPPHPSMLQAEQARAPMAGPTKEPVNRPENMGMPESFPGRNAVPGTHENPLSEDDKDDPQATSTQLLRLMQQFQINPMRNAGPNHGQPQSAGPAPGMMNMPPDVLPRPPGLQSPQKAPEFLDDPAIANMQRPEARRPPMGFFDEGPFPPNAQVPMPPGGSRVPQGQNSAVMGIQRPPGFEHMPPPPGWPGHQLPPQQAGGPGPLPPPPGIPARGINPNFMPNMMPMHGNMPPLSERQQFPRGPGGNGAAAFGPPPGMMPPPPGYMNMNGLPAGFPPEAFMGPGHGGQGPFGGHPGPQGPPPSSRQLLEMFGQGMGGEGRGIPGPGQFR